MKALIYNEKVIQLAYESYEVHPDLEWIDIPEGEEANVGDRYIGGLVLPSLGEFGNLTLEEARSKKLAAIQAAYKKAYAEKRFSVGVNQFPASEQIYLALLDAKVDGLQELPLIDTLSNIVILQQVQMDELRGAMKQWLMAMNAAEAQMQTEIKQLLDVEQIMAYEIVFNV